MNGFWIDGFWRDNVGSISIVPPVVTIEQNINTPALTADVVFELTANITEV